jgi:2,3-bisphosphoglycerate-dependent phosphoglycerate mutase
VGEPSVPDMIRILDPASKMKRETRILLLRHAETSAPDVFHGAESNIGLGTRGHQQAQAVALALAALAPDSLYCSAMRRAVETATPIGHACGLVPQLVESLHERRVGPLSGKSREEGMDTYEEAKQRWMAGDLDHTHEGGESYADMRRRVVPPFTDLVARHPGQTIIVVAHGIVIRVLLTTLLEGYDPQHFQAIAIPNAGVNDVRYNGERWRAERLAAD